MRGVIPTIITIGAVSLCHSSLVAQRAEMFSPYRFDIRYHWKLLLNPEVQCELKFTNEQRERIARVEPDLQKEHSAASDKIVEPDKELRSRKVIELAKWYRAERWSRTRAILSDEQYKRFYQIAVQQQGIRVFWIEDSKPLLKLTKGQWERIEEIESDAHRVLAEYYKNPSWDEMRRQFLQAVIASLYEKSLPILTGEQRQILDEFRGPPFKFSLMEGDLGAAPARIEARVFDLQPTEAELRFHEIGWASTTILGGLDLAKKHNRPLFLLASHGKLGRGRCESGGFFLRAGDLAKKETVDMLNQYFVPVHVDLAAYSPDSDCVSAEEKAILRKLVKEVKEPVSVFSATLIHVLDPMTGERIDGLGYNESVQPDKTTALLRRVIKDKKSAKGDGPVKPPALSQAEPKSDELLLHLVARYLPAGGTWKALPAEDYIALSRDEWKTLLPPERQKPAVGSTYEISKDVNSKMLVNFYPPTPNFDVTTNRIESPPLRATVVSIDEAVAHVRLAGELRMKHPFFPIKDDDRYVSAKLVGFLDVDLEKGRIKKLRLVSETAKYDTNEFGGAVRSLP